VGEVEKVSPAELQKYVKQKNIRRIFIDTETTGLDPFKDELVLIQVMAGGQVFFLEPDSDITGLMADTKITKVFQNAKFDIKFLLCHPTPLFDTYLAERMLTAGVTPLKELSLKDLTKKYCGIELDKSMRTTFKKGAELTPEQIKYAAMDVKVLEPIYEAQKRKLKEKDLVDTALLEFSIVPAVADIELAGMAVDLKKLEIMKTELGSRIALIEEQLRRHADINPRSPKQVKRALHSLGFKVENTQAKTLEGVDHPFAQEIIEHKKVAKLISSYVNSLPKHVNPKTGRIHPGFHQIGADTGRFSCSDPNLQQIPKEQEWRDLFAAPEGSKIITADYSQIELRILAEYSQDETFLEAYRTGQDLHSKTASEMLDMPIDQVGGPERNIAKKINFALSYGGGAGNVAGELDISVEQAQKHINAYFKAYPEVKATLQELGLHAVKEGYSQTLLGRKRYYRPANSYSQQKAIEREGRNMPIQGTCVDILKKAVKYLMVDLKDFDAKIVNLVHDEIVIECAEGQVDAVKEIVEQDMVRAGEDFLKSVPVEVDIKIDNVWRK
jgi:DNA polymerase-1